ncbi:MAG: flagellar motor protein MotB [Aestuariivirga sp.]|uniref:flagellar motor protein MotB n=1 Tax=Aestuariivirga sp. TaxID=2650926 RepID=UPI0038CF5C69
MSETAGGNPPEIVIVRRKPPDDGAGGKGGSWKIAYADFVTAMMAFFLVMWLINASNEEVKTQVANYFNPIKLTDSTTGARSVIDTADVEDSKKKTDRRNGQPPGVATDVAEDAALLSNPPVALDAIERKSAGGRDVGSRAGDVEDPAPAAVTDKSNPGIGDPFDPKSWQKEAVPVAPAVEDSAIKRQQNEQAASSGKLSASESVEASSSPAEKPAEPQVDARDAAGLDQAQKLLADIAAALGRPEKELGGSVDVKTTGDGLVISLTESEKFEMFKAGSAEPEPETLRLVAAIAKAIQTVPGGIFVRGHTDARPFRNRYYDNWQLSAARAQVARYMLLRGGLEDGRILRVEGVADREPLNAGNPLAAENRRIQFFIQMPKP